jgi:hypothetical protein
MHEKIDEKEPREKRVIKLIVKIILVTAMVLLLQADAMAI